ncbi:MAG: 23S rRNA (uracil(1939)-C(5))-methyltransferase RlmD, partial [Bacteroidota bacterium]
DCSFFAWGKRNNRKVFEQVEVTDAGAKGKAIAHAPDGRVIFLSNAVPGDVVDIMTTKKRKAYYEGRVLKIHSESEKRTTPKCLHFGVCGGCKWQNMDYVHQLAYKQNEVENHLRRIGNVALPEISPIKGSQQTYYYRNKMEFSFSSNRWLTEDEVSSGNPIKNRNALGFHIPGMWDKILDLKECHLQDEPSNTIRLAIKAKAEALDMPFFNPKARTGLLRTAMIRMASTGDLMVLIQFFEDDEAKRTALLQDLQDTFPQITSLLYVINQKGNDTLYDQEIMVFSGEDYIMEEMEGLHFKITAKSFYQTNSHQAYELYKVAREFAELSGKELVYDLYTGTGTIAQFVAKHAKKVIGVEAVPEAIADAKANAENNHIDNVEFVVGDMKKVFTDSFVNQYGHPDVVITDPPRDGMHKDVVEKLLEVAPERIVYISCNSATQARDLALLKEKYTVLKVQPVDMFPQTHHVENIVLLGKQE